MILKQQKLVTAEKHFNKCNSNNTTKQNELQTLKITKITKDTIDKRSIEIDSISQANLSKSSLLSIIINRSPSFFLT